MITTTTIEILGLPATLTKDEDALKYAFDKNWQSLYFSDNGTVFICIAQGPYSLSLSTTGEVELNVDGKIYSNEDKVDIIDILDSRFVLKEENLIFSNWFSYEFFCMADGSYTYDVYGNLPLSEEELISDMIKLFETLYVSKPQNT